MSEDRKTWVHRYFLGECTLFEAMTAYMLHGQPVPGQLVEAFLRAQMTYDSEKDADFAMLVLGYTTSQRERNNMAKDLRYIQIRQAVESMAERTGARKVNPNHFDKTVFHLVGAEFHLSPATVHDIFYQVDSFKKLPDY